MTPPAEGRATGRGMRHTIAISEARGVLNTIDERLASERVIYVMRHGKPVFAIVEPDYLWAILETLAILADPDVCALLRQSQADIDAGRLHDHADVRRDLG